MKYRAEARGLEIKGRKITTYWVDIRVAEDWANKTAAENNVKVDIFITEERLLMTVNPPAPVPAAPASAPVVVAKS